MDLDKAIDGMMATRAALRSKEGVSDPNFISENMQRLAQYVGAVEEHLAKLEEEIEVAEMQHFMLYTKEESRSVAQAYTLAKKDVGELRGQIQKLKRYVNSSWQIVGVAQSRFNHLSKGIAGQI